MQYPSAIKNSRQLRSSETVMQKLLELSSMFYGCGYFSKILSHTINYKSRSLRKRKPGLFYSPRLYHTSISPLSVRTSMIVCPRKSSDSRLNFCLTRDLMSSSSSHTRTFIRSEELWHSLKRQIRPFSYTTMYSFLSNRNLTRGYSNGEVNCCTYKLKDSSQTGLRLP